MARDLDKEYDDYFEKVLKHTHPYEYLLLRTPLIENMRRRVFHEPSSYMEPLKVHGKSAQEYIKYSSLVFPSMAAGTVKISKLEEHVKEIPEAKPEYIQRGPWFIRVKPTNSPGQQ